VSVSWTRSTWRFSEKSFSEYHSSCRSKPSAYFFEPGEFGSTQRIRALLLGAVLDEFAADEADIRVGLGAVIDVAIGALLRFVLRVEGIARGMGADEAVAC
jgi:hypothetical protein